MRKLMKYLWLLIVFAVVGNGFYITANADEKDSDDPYEQYYDDIFIYDEVYYYYQNPDTGYMAGVEDDADRLTDDEEYMLLFDMIGITEYGNVYFKSITENSYSDSSSYAEHFLNDEKNCYGGVSGTVFLDDTKNRRLEIFSNGKIHSYVTNGKAVSITDNIYKYASNEQYYECYSEAYTQMETLLEGGKIAEPMKKISCFLLSVILSLFVCYLIAMYTSNIKNNGALSADELIKVEFTNVTSTFHTATKTYSPPSSSSSGGGGGGGGGGGHGY